MTAETELTVNDNVKTHEPDFDVGMSIVNGKPTYWITERVETWAPNDKGGQTCNVIDRTIDVSAELWRDALALLRVAEIRQLRSMLREALDPDIEDTVASGLKRIAAQHD